MLFTAVFAIPVLQPVCCLQLQNRSSLVNHSKLFTVIIFVGIQKRTIIWFIIFNVYECLYILPFIKCSTSLNFSLWLCCLPIHFHFARAYSNEEPFDYTAQNFFSMETCYRITHGWFCFVILPNPFELNNFLFSPWFSSTCDTYLV